MSEMAKDGNRTIIRDTVKPVIAQMLGVEPDTIDEIIIITRGECNSCENRNMITLLDTITNDEEFAEVMSNALITRVEGELFLCHAEVVTADVITALRSRCSHTCGKTRISWFPTRKSRARFGRSTITP